MSLVIYFGILLIGILLWVRGLVIVNKRNELVKYAIFNSVIFVIYSALWFNHSQLITGHDEYGLGALFGYPLILVIHSVLVFVILLITFRKREKVPSSMPKDA